MSSAATRPSGWYDDATDAALLRYWDGSGWTPHTAARHGLAGPVEGALEPGLGLTARLPHLSSTPDHTTVPTPPASSAASPTTGVLGDANRMSPLPLVGTITAAASLVVAVAALSVALGR